MKRIIIIALFILCSNLGVSASDSTEEKIIESIAPYIVENENANISRGNCVASVMKLIGVDKDTAELYADMDFDQPVFYDFGYGDANDGYIILARESDIAFGVYLDERNIGNFEPDRRVTNKECLAFMLRCLKGTDKVNWNNIMTDSVEIGLLKEGELESYIEDALLLNKDFYTLLSRMLNMNRHMYWSTEDPPAGYAKEVRVDQTNSITYIEWIISRTGT